VSIVPGISPNRECGISVIDAILISKEQIRYCEYGETMAAASI